MSDKKEYFIVYPLDFLLRLLKTIIVNILHPLNKLLDFCCLIILGGFLLLLDIIAFIFKILFYFLTCIKTFFLSIIGVEFDDDNNYSLYLDYLFEPVFYDKKPFEVLGYLVFYCIAKILDNLFDVLFFIMKSILLSIVGLIFYAIEFFSFPFRAFLAVLSNSLTFNADEELAKSINDFFDVRENVFISYDSVFCEYKSNYNNCFDVFYNTENSVKQ